MQPGIDDPHVFPQESTPVAQKAQAVDADKAPLLSSTASLSQRKTRKRLSKFQMQLQLGTLPKRRSVEAAVKKKVTCPPLSVVH